MNTYAEFWPFYLREHSKASTRMLHFVGTTLATASLVSGVVLGRWGLCVAAPFFGYAFAWTAHFGIEKNRPATFKYPLWSLASDYKMLACALRGTLDAELKRAGVGVAAAGVNASA